MGKAIPRLGRGLSTLIAPRATHLDMPSAAGTHADAPGPRLCDLPVDRIVPNPRQPRSQVDDASVAELAESVRTTGVLQPVLVRPAADGNHELVAGERRWRAARLAGHSTIPALVRDVTDAEALEIALIENLQRKDLSPLERASAYQRYTSTFGGTVDELANKLAESRANIVNYIRLLNLHPEVRELLASDQLAMGQARAIAGVDMPEHQLRIARQAVRYNMSVRQVEELARSFLPGAQPKAHESDAIAESSRRRHMTELETELGRTLGVQVRIFPGRAKNSGRVIISYSSLEEFDRIAARLGAQAATE